MGLLNDEQRKEFFKLKLTPPHDKSVPYKREWRRGAESAFLGRKISENPWDASWQRRNNAVYSGAWRSGYKAAQEELNGG